MFKAIKDNKIIAINDTGDFPCLVFDEVIEDTEHAVDEYEHYQGEFLLKYEIPAPTKEEVAEKRRSLYIEQKDPLTCQIQALRDEPQTQEILNEIEALQEERKRVVEKIKNENPYPVE